MRPFVVGVLNVTPDSFSDGGNFFDPERAITHALTLVADGADYIEVGGDSTRPGSRCVGPEEEWRRIEPVISGLKSLIPIIVDTHHAQVVEKALNLGVIGISDVSGGGDSEVVAVIRGSAAKFVVMHSASGIAHFFSEITGDPTLAIMRWFSERLTQLVEAGVERGQIILDTGLGGFLSKDPQISDQVVRDYHKFAEFGLPLYFGCSRKGFLGSNLTLETRDALSANLGLSVATRIEVPLYLRVHNVAMQRSVLG